MKKLFLFLFLLFASNCYAVDPEIECWRNNPTVDTDAYTANEIVGGLQSLQDSDDRKTIAGYVVSASVIDTEDLKEPFDLWFFCQKSDQWNIHRHDSV